MFRNVDLDDWGQAVGSETTVSTETKDWSVWGSVQKGWGFWGRLWGNVGHEAAAKRDAVQLISQSEFGLPSIRRLLVRILLHGSPMMTMRRGRILFRKYVREAVGETSENANPNSKLFGSEGQRSETWVVGHH